VRVEILAKQKYVTTLTNQHLEYLRIEKGIPAQTGYYSSAAGSTTLFSAQDGSQQTGPHCEVTSECRQ
jgi:hypothetical protein